MEKGRLEGRENPPERLQHGHVERLEQDIPTSWVGKKINSGTGAGKA